MTAALVISLFRTGTFQDYYRRSTDGGARFEAEILLPSDPLFANAARPTIAVRDATVHVAWFGFTDFEADVYHACPPDDGRTWSEAFDLTEDGAGAAPLPHVAVDRSGAPHVIWYDTRHSDASGPRVEVYYARPWG